MCLHVYICGCMCVCAFIRYRYKSNYCLQLTENVASVRQRQSIPHDLTVEAETHLSQRLRKSFELIFEVKFTHCEMNPLYWAYPNMYQHPLCLVQHHKMKLCICWLIPLTCPPGPYPYSLAFIPVDWTILNTLWEQDHKVSVPICLAPFTWHNIHQIHLHCHLLWQCSTKHICTYNILFAHFLVDIWTFPASSVF